MRIRSTIRPPQSLTDAVTATRADEVADRDEPAVSVVAVAGTGAALDEDAAWKGVIGLPLDDSSRLHDVIKGRPVKLARGLWSQIAPAVPPQWRTGVKAAWIVVDGTALISRFASLDAADDRASYAELMLDAAGLGIDALSLANTASGRADNAAEIDQVGLLLQFGRDVADGKDFALVGAEDLVKAEVPLYKVGKSYLGLLETALGTKDLELSAGKWMIGDQRPNYHASVEPGLIARFAQAQRDKKDT